MSNFDPRADLAELKARQFELRKKRHAFLSVLGQEMDGLRQASEAVFQKALLEINEELQPLQMKVAAIVYPHYDDGTQHGAFSSLHFRLTHGLNDVLGIKAKKNGDPDENYEALMEFCKVAQPFIELRRLALNLDDSLPIKPAGKVAKL